MANFLPDPYPWICPRLSAWIQIADGIGISNAGVNSVAFTDFDDFLINGHSSPTPSDDSADNLIAAGIRELVFGWAWGQTAAGDEYTAGAVPNDYPGSGSNPANCQPINPVLHEEWVGTSYLDQIVGDLDTAGRKGSLARMTFYGGSVEAFCDVSDPANLDAYSDIPEQLGADVAYDIQSVLDYNNVAPPTAANTLEDLRNNTPVLIGWWRADRGAFNSGTTPATNGQTVETWADQSGLGNDFTQTGSGTIRPVFHAGVVNGHPVLRFDGADDFMTLASSLAISDYTVFVVCKSDTNTDMMLLSVNAAFTNRQLCRFNELSMGVSTGRVSLWDGTAATITAPATWTAGGFDLLTFSCTDTQPADIAVNGTDATYDIHQNSAGDMEIDRLGSFGPASSPTKWFDGDVAEIIICNELLTDNLRQLIENYLRQKYDLNSNPNATPILPHRAHILRRLELAGLRTIGESWERRDVADLQGWISKQQAIFADTNRATLAIGDPLYWHTRESARQAGMRARIGIFNNGPTVAQRIESMKLWLSLGYDVCMDFGGFSTAEIESVVEYHRSLCEWIKNLSASRP